MTNSARIFCVISLGVICLLRVAQAQPYTIAGTVKSGATGVGISSALVVIKQSDTSTVIAQAYTRWDGTFSKGGFAEGSYDLTITKGGYTFNDPALPETPNISPIVLGPSRLGMVFYNTVPTPTPTAASLTPSPTPTPTEQPALCPVGTFGIFLPQASDWDGYIYALGSPPIVTVDTQGATALASYSISTAGVRSSSHAVFTFDTSVPVYGTHALTTTPYNVWLVLTIRSQANDDDAWFALDYHSADQATIIAGDAGFSSNLPNGISYQSARKRAQVSSITCDPDSLPCFSPLQLINPNLLKIGGKTKISVALGSGSIASGHTNALAFGTFDTLDGSEAILVACMNPTPTPTATHPTYTPTPTWTPIQTSASTRTKTTTPAKTSTPTRTPTFTPTPTINPLTIDGLWHAHWKRTPCVIVTPGTSGKKFFALGNVDYFVRAAVAPTPIVKIFVNGVNSPLCTGTSSPVSCTYADPTPKIIVNYTFNLNAPGTPSSATASGAYKATPNTTPGTVPSPGTCIFNDTAELTR